MNCESEAYYVPVTAEELVRAPRPIQLSAAPVKAGRCMDDCMSQRATHVE